MPGEPSAQQLQKEERLQELKAAVDLTVTDICSELETELGLNFSPQVVAALTQLTLEKNKRSAEDLEAFAQHAKRTTITADDVKLLTRRNVALKEYLVQSEQTGAGPGPKHVKSSNAGKRSSIGIMKSSAVIGDSNGPQPLID